MSDDEDHDFQKGDYVQLKDTGEMGRIVAAGENPGCWRVRFDTTGEREVPETSLDPIY